MILRLAFRIACAAGLAAAFLGAASAEERTIVGSSTVAPFARAVIARKAAQFSAHLAFDPQGSNAGIRGLCAGEWPLTLASRRMSPEELKACSAGLGARVSEHVLGRSGLVLMTFRANAIKSFSVSRQQLFRALAAEVPDADCRLVPNTAMTWQDVDRDLPKVDIVVYGPSKAHGVRSTFEKLALVKGAERDDCMARLEAQTPGTIGRVARSIRTDGVWTDMDDERTAFVTPLSQTAGALAVLTYSDVNRFKQHLEVVRVDGRAPTLLNLTRGTYPLTTSLYMYTNDPATAADPVMVAFAAAMTAPEALGPMGYLSELGLISIPPESGS